MINEEVTIRYKYLLIDTILTLLLLYILGYRFLQVILIVLLSCLVANFKIGYIVFDLIEFRTNIFLNYDYGKRIDLIKDRLKKITKEDTFVDIDNLNINIIKNSNRTVYTSSIFNIYISENLFNNLNNSQLLAVMLHELGHIKNKDLHLYSYIINKNCMLVLIFLYKKLDINFIFIIILLYVYIYLSYIFIEKESLKREILADYYVQTCGYRKELIELLEKYKLLYNEKFNYEYMEPNKKYIDLERRIEVLKNSS